MRHLMILCLCLVLVGALPATVRAQGPDTIGLWFDPAYTINVAPIPTNLPFEAYLVLHEPSADAVGGAVFEFEISDNMIFVLATAWPLDPIVQMVGDCTMMSYPAPRPAEPDMLLTTFTYLIAHYPPRILFYVRPCDGQACPYYLDASGAPVCMETSLGNGLVGCLGECSVGTDAVRWTAVKSLYR